MGELLDAAPIAAAAFAIPQFLPQLIKLRRTGDTAGVSWPWATLTSVNNAAWVVYFVLSAYWAALVPASSATLLAGALSAMLALRGRARARPAVLIGAWVALLAAAFILAGRAGLGALLTAAFVVQVAPSVWTAYRTACPSGISAGTWMLIFGELSCWMVFGVHKSDPRLLILGFTGVTASLLMLARIRRTTKCNRRQRRSDLSRLPVNVACWHQPAYVSPQREPHSQPSQQPTPAQDLGKRCSQLGRGAEPFLSGPRPDGNLRAPDIFDAPQADAEPVGRGGRSR
jgi:uncharacterized protein with PQ loop repeat